MEFLGAGLENLFKEAKYKNEKYNQLDKKRRRNNHGQVVK